MTKKKERLGEENPGFNYWTSAHGFRHLALSTSKAWTIAWAVFLVLLICALVGCIIYYFYFVFSAAVYSKITMESPKTWLWPHTIICDQQTFLTDKIEKPLSTTHASIVSWSISPLFARPDIIETDSSYPILMKSINEQANNSLEALMRSWVPSCSELILECVIGNKVIEGTACCQRFFNPEPVIGQKGVCYSTRGAEERISISATGEESAVTFTIMLGRISPFVETYASTELVSLGKGVNFAITDDRIGIDAALKQQGHFVQPGLIATAGISKTVIDDSELAASLIGRRHCLSSSNDADFMLGVGKGAAYTKASCETTAKDEILARAFFQCTLGTGDVEYKRCTPAQSASFHRSFVVKGTSSKGIRAVDLDSDGAVKARYEKSCPQECLQERHVLTLTSQSIPNTLITEIDQKLSKARAPGSKVVVLKLAVNSLEFMHIRNFPHHGLQFIAEVGALVAFFLGVSIVSIVECICFGISAACGKCCRGGTKTTEVKEVKPVPLTTQGSIIQQRRGRDEERQDRGESGDQLNRNADSLNQTVQTDRVQSAVNDRKSSGYWRNRSPSEHVKWNI